MASTEDKMTKTQMSFGKILNTISAAAAPDSPEEKRRYRQDEELEGQVFLARSVEKRGLLDIDLNVAPPEDGGSESPSMENGGSESLSAENGGDGHEIPPTAAAVVSEESVCFANERGSKFNEIVEVHDEVFKVNSEIRDEIQAHLSKGEIVEEDEQMENITVTDSEKGEEKKERRKNIRWNTLLEAAKNALRDYEENVRNKEEKVHNRKRRRNREVEIGGELHKATVRKKVNGRNSAERWIEAAEFLAAPPVVVRSTRGRAVAMPNKYRDSFLHAAAAMAVAEARFSRHNTKRKSR